MKRIKAYFSFFLSISLTACTSFNVNMYKEARGIESVEEASNLSLDFIEREFVPPKRSIVEIREKFKEVDSWQLDCAFVRERYDLNWDVYMDLAASGLRSGAYWIAFLSEQELIRGNFEKAIESTLFAFGQLRPPTETWERTDSWRQLPYAVLSAALGRMYARIGKTDEARDWLERSLLYWSRADSKGENFQSPGAIYSVLAELAALDGDLLAEEFYLREGLPLIWQARIGPKANPHGSGGINVEYSIARLSKNLIMQNRPIESELVLTEYLTKTYNEIQPDNVPLMTTALAESLYTQGRLEEAEYAARLALTMHRNMCAPIDAIPRADTLRVLFKILLSRGDWQELANLNETLKTELADQPGRYSELYGGNPDLLLAEFFSRRASSLELVRLAEIAKGKTQEVFGTESIEHLEAQAVLAVILAMTDDIDRAYDAFAESLAGLQSLSSFSPANYNRYQLFRNEFIRFLSSSEGRQSAANKGHNPIELSFLLANSNKVGNVQRNLSVAALKSGVEDDVLAKELELLKDIELKIQNTLEQIVFIRSGKAAESIGSQDLEQQYKVLRASKRNIENNIDGRFPEYGQILNPRPPEVDAIRQSLSPGELLVTYHLGESKSYVWALGKNQGLSFHSIDQGKVELNAKIRKLRATILPTSNTLDGIPDFDVELAYELYEDLLGNALSSKNSDVKNLIIVPSGDLGSLPMGLLVTEQITNNQGASGTINSQSIQERGLKKVAGNTEVNVSLDEDTNLMFGKYSDVPWLIKQASITVVPSASNLVLLRQLEDSAQSSSSFIGFGDPLFSADQTDANEQLASINASVGQSLVSRSATLEFRVLPDTRSSVTADLSVLPPLPETSEELVQIASILNARMTDDLFLGSQASEQNVKEQDLSNTTVLIFATHGLLPGDLDGLDQPALALSNPTLSQSSGDGLLKMEEILTLDLNADWVILSACNTASGDGDGAEAFSGLGQAFFFAGARSLLLSNWSVETVSAKLLTTGIFEASVSDWSLTRAQALRASSLKLMKQTADDQYSYAHPIFWAPFTLVGDGG